MDQHPPSLPALGSDALGAQWTYPTYRPVELEGLQAVGATGAICPLSQHCPAPLALIARSITPRHNPVGFRPAF